jgi:glutamate decarboxylase
MLHRLVYGESDSFYQQWTQNFTYSLGVFCSGGTIANVTALWAARNQRFAPRGDFNGVQQDGLAAGLLEYGYRGAAVLVSKRGHYSLRKAADALGLGTKNLVPVDITPDHKIDISALRRQIADLQKKQILPLAIVGIAGATETGSVDPLRDLAEIAQEAGAHFHVDAAWGGPALFSERHGYLLDGIGLADSVTIDAHKQLYVPVGAGMVIFKDRQALTAVEHHANYIIRKGSRDIGKHTLEGTRPGTAMLVHSALQIIGRKGYELLIDVGIGKAKQFAKMIRTSDYFELVTEPELNLLTYRFRPPGVKELLETASPEVVKLLNQVLSTLTESIQKEQRSLGKTFVSRTRLESASYGGDILSVFRVVLANPLTTRQILTDILAEQIQHGLKLLKDDGYDAVIAALKLEPHRSLELLQGYLARLRTSERD